VITADQLVAHLVGDYLLQSDWMASVKTQRFAPAAAHALVYSLTFLLFSPSLVAWFVILLTHFAIDRWRLARYVVWAKNWMAPKWVVSRREYKTDHATVSEPIVARNLPWSECASTGYPSRRPDWLAVWLLIIADNILHILINGVALAYL
jgi:hypothetical protein